jgi:hypothetical protein
VRRLAVGVLACVALPAPARAYRPFNSTDAAVAAAGEIELEVGPAGFLKEGSERWLVAPALILNWGFARSWEVVLEGRQLIHLGAAVAGARVAVEDVALSLKTVLRDGALQEASGLSIASELSALLPAVDGESGAGAEAALIASHRSDAVTAHLNLAASWTRAPGPCGRWRSYSSRQSVTCPPPFRRSPAPSGGCARTSPSMRRCGSRAPER